MCMTYFLPSTDIPFCIGITISLFIHLLLDVLGCFYLQAIALRFVVNICVHISFQMHDFCAWKYFWLSLGVGYLGKMGTSFLPSWETLLFAIELTFQPGNIQITMNENAFYHHIPPSICCLCVFEVYSHWYEVRFYCHFDLFPWYKMIISTFHMLIVHSYIHGSVYSFLPIFSWGCWFSGWWVFWVPHRILDVCPLSDVKCLLPISWVSL